MKETVILDWTYVPTNYFEAPFSFEGPEKSLVVIDNGNVQATLPAEVYDKDPGLAGRLHKSIESVFASKQTVIFEPYNLSESTKSRQRPDGRKTTEIKTTVIAINVATDRVSYTIRDRDGNVTKDSRAERISEEQAAAKRMDRFCRQDPTLRAMVDSFGAAINDPSDELVHLYEIREALCRRLGGSSGVKQHFGISDHDWTRFDDLTCREPLRQGRHRGRHADTLRDASPDELMEARNFSRDLIESYLSYLEGKVLSP